MNCQKCKSDRVASINGKTSDCCFFCYKGKEQDGYVPSDIGVDDGGGDYIEFDYCLECGQIQGDFPIADPTFDDDDDD